MKRFDMTGSCAGSAATHDRDRTIDPSGEDGFEGAKVVLMLSTMLHSIGVGNMLPSWVRVVCVDINPAVVTKLADRGSHQAHGIVTDVGEILSLRQQGDLSARIACGYDVSAIDIGARSSILPASRPGSECRSTSPRRRAATISINTRSRFAIP